MSLPALVVSDFWNHPKLLRLVRALGTHPRVMVGGSLVCLWGHCHRYAPDGDLSDHSDDEIAAAADWPADPAAYVKALQDCGWLDGKCVHNFAERQGKKAVANAQAAHRMANKRERDRNGVTPARNASEPERNPSSVAVPLPLPVPLPSPKDSCSPKGRRAFVYPEDFEGFYSNYPRKVGKGAALRAWSKLTANDRLLAQAAIANQEKWPCFSEAPPDKQPHPSTWLNARRWEDEPPPARTLPRTGPRLEVLGQETSSALSIFPEVENA